MDVGPVTRLDPRTDSNGSARTQPRLAGIPPTTDLAPAQVVTAPDGAAKPGDRDGGQGGAGSRERHVSIDAATRSVVSQVIDRDTGDLLSQVPDQALLRYKAYAREVVADLDARRTGRVERLA